MSSISLYKLQLRQTWSSRVQLYFGFHESAGLAMGFNEKIGKIVELTWLWCI